MRAPWARCLAWHVHRHFCGFTSGRTNNGVALAFILGWSLRWDVVYFNPHLPSNFLYTLATRPFNQTLYSPFYRPFLSTSSVLPPLLWLSDFQRSTLRIFAHDERCFICERSTHFMEKYFGQELCKTTSCCSVFGPFFFFFLTGLAKRNGNFQHGHCNAFKCLVFKKKRVEVFSVQPMVKYWTPPDKSNISKRFSLFNPYLLGSANQYFNTLSCLWWNVDAARRLWLALRVLLVSACVLSGYSGFRPQSNDMHVKLMNNSKLPLGVTLCAVGCFSLHVALPWTADLSRL